MKLSTRDQFIADTRKFKDIDASIHGTEKFSPRASDIFIATYPKCGTTWVTQICQMLKSDGDMNFSDITGEVPWDVMAKLCKQDLDADQKYDPRLFKSHEDFDHIAKGAKYIHVLRDPYDAMMSFYWFQLGKYSLSPNDLPLEEFASACLDPKFAWGNMPHFYATWIKARETSNNNILWLYYEDLKKDTKAGIEKIARFMGLDKLLDEDTFAQRCAKAFEKSTLSFMLENEAKFRTQLVFENTKHIYGKRMENFKSMGVAKVRTGKTGAGKELPVLVKTIIDYMWKQEITVPYGFETYDELRNQLS